MSDGPRFRCHFEGAPFEGVCTYRPTGHDPICDKPATIVLWEPFPLDETKQIFSEACDTHGALARTWPSAQNLTRIHDHPDLHTSPPDVEVDITKEGRSIFDE